LGRCPVRAGRRGRPETAACCGAAPSSTMRGTLAVRFATGTTQTTATGTTGCGWGWRRLIPLQSKRLAGNVARLRLGDRGIERKRGLSLAAVAGLRARRLGRIQNSPGPWAADVSLVRGASFAFTPTWYTATGFGWGWRFHPMLESLRH
jgi:hypothetical protein